MHAYIIQYQGWLALGALAMTGCGSETAALHIGASPSLAAVYPIAHGVYQPDKSTIAPLQGWLALEREIDSPPVAARYDSGAAVKLPHSIS